MKSAESAYPARWSSSFTFASLAHLALAAFMIFGPAIPDRQAARQDVLLVRLSGGGENRPGWIKPTTAPADLARVPDGKPIAASKERVEAAKEQEVAPEINKPMRVESDEKEGEEIHKPVEEAETATVMAEAEAGEGVGAKPGPEGPGFGLKSDADFPGADAFLSRLEAEVQRRFNFRGSGSGAVAEYHFFIERNGKTRDLILMVSSGIASLDMAARSAIVRSKFPPLPVGFRHERLGVTYLFYDAD